MVLLLSSKGSPLRDGVSSIQYTKGVWTYTGKAEAQFFKVCTGHGGHAASFGSSCKILLLAA